MRMIYFLLIFFLCIPAFSLENIFYILHDNYQNALAWMTKYRPYVDKLIVQSFQIDKNGQVSGQIDPEILSFSRAHAIPMYVMVTNVGFKVSEIHAFLSNTAAQQKVLNQLITICKKEAIFGVQFDLEMIPLKDRDLLTAFYSYASIILHGQGFHVSFAVAPLVADHDFKSHYQKKLFEVWQGAYDIEKLGKISDFLTIMSYDQHGEGTTPGAIASIPWDMEVIKYALQFVPAEKISLGIPTYSGLWYMGMNEKSGRITIHYDSVDNKTVQYMLNKYQLFIHWDDRDNVNYSFYDSNGVNKYLFIENAKSFEAKYDLAKKYNLGSVSIFRLGIEDPKIWEILIKNRNEMN